MSADNVFELRASNYSRIRARERAQLPEWQQFRRWYDSYPRRTHEHDAARAWVKLLPDEREVCIENTPKYRRMWALSGRLIKHVPHPATFLNSRAWAQPPQDENLPVSVEEILGPCVWNKGRSLYPFEPECTEAATVVHPESGRHYCAVHARKMGLKVRAA